MAELPYNDFYSTRTDAEIDDGIWQEMHNAKVFSKFYDSPGATHEDIYNTMVTVGLFYAIKYYTGHKDQARAIKDSTEYTFAARAASESLNPNRPIYQVDRSTNTVFEIPRAPLWGGSKRFKKKSRRRRNRKTTRRRRRKY
jgi:hypothetical protein